jgi:hypothetical protein
MQTCKMCGADGLTWKKTVMGWRLFKANGVKHSCQSWVPPKGFFPQTVRVNDRKYVSDGGGCVEREE